MTTTTTDTAFLTALSLATLRAMHNDLVHADWQLTAEHARKMGREELERRVRAHIAK